MLIAYLIGRHSSILSNDCSSCNNTVTFNFCAPSDGWTHANKGVVLDFAWLNKSIWTDSHIIADFDSLAVLSRNKWNEILNDGVLSDFDLFAVSSDDRTIPNRTILAELNVSDDNCVWCDEFCVSDLRADVFIWFSSQTWDNCGSKILMSSIVNLW